MVTDARDCKCCGALYLGPTCLECMDWSATGIEDMQLGYRPLFTLTQGQIHDQMLKMRAGGYRA